MGNIRFTNTASVANVITHDGPFQADDAMACAIIALARGRETLVLRTRDPSIIAGAGADTVVADVGGVFDVDALRFDHHQRGFDQTRVSGVKYAACGLVWDFMPGAARKVVRHVSERLPLPHPLTGAQVVAVADKVGRGLIAAVDAIDNGQKARPAPEQEVVPPTFSLSTVIHQLNPGFTDDPRAFDLAFGTAAEMCVIVLESAVKQAVAEVLSEGRVAEAVSRGDSVVVFDQYEASALELVPVLSDEALYMVFPSNGTWMVQQVPKSPGSFEGRKPLPREWAGLRSDNGDTIEGLESFVFVHNGRFIGGCKDEEDAVRMARMAVEA